MTGIETTPIIINGMEYLMPDWNLRTAQKIAPFIDLLTNPKLENRVEILAKSILLSLQGSYPELTEDYILDNAKYYELSGFMEAINGQLFKKKPEKNLELTSLSIGEKSMPELSRQQAGPGSI